MKIKFLTLLILTLFLTNCKTEKIIINGHSHNDYEHEKPLFDALENGFLSIEADVHFKDNNLYVSHNYQQIFDSSQTLEKMYLAPLKKLIDKNNGFVYSNNSDQFYLMIDFKSTSQPSYNKLKEILSNYLSILSIVKDGIEKKGAVKIFISGPDGNRPFDEIINDNPQIVSLDGRPKDLGKNIPALIMPVVSDNYKNFLSWNGNGKIDQNEKEILINFINETHKQNKKVRLWASPENKVVWKFLLDNGVDFINTDLLKELNEFMQNYNKTSNS